MDGKIEKESQRERARWRKRGGGGVRHIKWHFLVKGKLIAKSGTNIWHYPYSIAQHNKRKQTNKAQCYRCTCRLHIANKVYEDDIHLNDCILCSRLLQPKGKIANRKSVRSFTLSSSAPMMARNNRRLTVNAVACQWTCDTCLWIIYSISHSAYL